MSDSLVIIPTYNERENIESIIRAVMALPKAFHILIVDDGSPDGTADIIKDLQAKEYGKELHLLQRSGKLGLGTAYIAGFRWAIEKGYDYVCEMDADFSHNPNDLPRLYEACSQAGIGMSVGSRYVAGGKLENWPLLRVLISKGASFYVRLVTRMPVKDATAGFVCYRREALDSIDLDRIRFIGYAFQIEMKFALWMTGFKIKEVPITFKDREVGVSKMSTKIFNEAFIGVLKMRYRAFFSNYKKTK